MSQELKPSFRLEARELSTFWKTAQVWPLVQKKTVLRRWETRGDTFFVTMWNGDQYQIKKGEYETKYETEPRSKVRTIQIKLPNQHKKLYIREMVPMYPNGERDFDALIAEVGASEGARSKLFRWGEIVENVSENLPGK